MEEGFLLWSCCLSFGFDFLWSFSLLKFLQQHSTIAFFPTTYRHSLEAAQQMKHSLFITEAPLSCSTGVMTLVLSLVQEHLRFKNPMISAREKGPATPSRTAPSQHSHCRDRTPAPLLLWTHKTFFMARRSTEAMSKGCLPTSLAFSWSFPDLVTSLCPPGLPWRGTDHPYNWIWI